MKGTKIKANRNEIQKMEQTCGRNNQRMKMRGEEIRKKTRKRDGKVVKERKEGQR